MGNREGLWAEGTQKSATAWYLQYFTVDSEHKGVEEDEDTGVTRVYIWKGLCHNREFGRTYTSSLDRIIRD